MDPQISMNQAFISKLNDILEENYQKETFGVKELVKEAGVSRSQLHRKLQEVKGVSSSQFIRNFRLGKAYGLLQKDVSTVSEIAYAVGFGSPSYFVKCFHKRYKCSPGELKNNPQHGEFVAPPIDKIRQLSSFSFKKGMLLGVLVVLLAMGGYVVGHLVPEKKYAKQVTLAVLPFKNLSNNESDQYFADGVMDVILSNLSGVEGIGVISRTTMEQYRETSKTIPEITKELDISHVLEASVQKQANKIRIVVQLIDAKSDVNIWSNHYERLYEDIFTMQSEIAREIAKQLEITLSPADEERIAKIPTKNFEAYNLYLKGRFFWDRRKEADLKRSVQYFEQAIALDSLYAPAYAGLAASYNVMVVWGWYHPREEGFRRAKMYADKALYINKNISLAYAVLGNISQVVDWNWKQAEEAFKQAIILEPNSSTAHQWYAELLNVLGRRDEAREHIKLAIKYNPNAPLVYSQSSQIYYNNGEFEKAIEETKKAYELGGFSLHYRFYCYVRLKEGKQAVETLKLKFTELQTYPEIIDSIYKASGIEGIVNWYIGDIKFGTNGCFNSARLCMLIGDTKRALEYLESSYEHREFSFPRIKHYIDFEPLHSEPRYIALVNKLNME